MRFPNPYWSEMAKANALQRWVIVHSIRYYEMDSSLVSDHMFNENCKQLVELMESLPKSKRESTEYWYVMHDFDGSTGFHLYKRLNKHDQNYLYSIAQKLHDVNQATGFGRVQ